MKQMMRTFFLEGESPTLTILGEVSSFKLVNLTLRKRGMWHIHNDNLIDHYFFYKILFWHKE